MSKEERLLPAYNPLHTINFFVLFIITCSKHRLLGIKSCFECKCNIWVTGHICIQDIHLLSWKKGFHKVPSTMLHSTMEYFLFLWVSYPVSLMRHVQAKWYHSGTNDNEMAELELEPIRWLYFQVCPHVIEQGLCSISAQISYLQLMFCRRKFHRLVLWPPRSRFKWL